MRRAYILCILAAVVIGLIVGRRFRSPASSSPHPVALAEPVWPLSQAIDEAGGYITRANGDDGRFVYLMTPDGGSLPQYNVVRHAGAIYALADYQAQASTPEARAKASAASTRAAAQLVSRYIRPLKEHPDVAAVWSDPAEEGGAKESAKLGGSALGMVGLLGLVRAIDGGAANVVGIQKLGKYIVLMQQPSGEFLQTYTDDGRRLAGNTLYFPGEAILGLAMLYEIDRDPQWLDAALKGVAFLVDSYRTKSPLPDDHWLMIAIDRLLPLVGDAKSPPVTREQMIDQSLAIGRAMMDEQVKTAAARPEIEGAFSEDGNTGPSATRCEGLLALEHALGTDPARAADRATVRKAIVRGIAFIRRSQSTSGPTRGGIPISVSTTAAGAVRGEGADEEKRGEIRIDLVQHALSAMMRYSRMCAADATACTP